MVDLYGYTARVEMVAMYGYNENGRYGGSVWIH